MRLLLSSLLLLGLSVFAKDIPLIADGTAKFAIVVENPRNTTTAMAGEELALHLEKRTGTKVQVLGPEDIVPAGTMPFYLGISERTKQLGLDESKLEDDGYFLKVTDKYAVIAGRDNPIKTEPMHGHDFIYCNKELNIYAIGETGTQNGVYKFLGRFAGVRWYMPGELGTIVPKDASFSVPEMEYYDAPAFCYRLDYGMYFRDAAPENLYYYKRQCAGAAKNIFINHSFSAMFYKYKDSNPEYFALIDGKRDLSNLSTANYYGNLCMSKPEVAKAFAGIIIEYFKKHPEMDVYPVVPQDGMFRVCECPDCQKLLSPHLGEKGKFSNLVFTLVKGVADEVAKVYPNKFIGTLAYEGYEVPPDFAMPTNVVVRICYTMKGLRDPARKEHVFKLIKGFHEKGVKVSTWTYGLFDHIPPFRGLPIFYPEMLQENIQFWKANGVIGEFYENEFRSGGGDTYLHVADKALQGIAHLNDYVHYQLLWNPDLDMKALLSEYYELFYGPASVQMRNFWETARDMFLKGNEKSPLTQYTLKDLQELYRLLDVAKDTAGGQGAYSERIALIRKEMDTFIPQMMKELSYKKLFSVAKVKGAIPMEDAPDKGVWSYARTYKLGKRDGLEADPKFETIVRALANTEGLALYCFAKEPDMEHLVVRTKERDDLDTWLDDSLEFYVVTEDRTENRQYIVTAAGNFFDMKRGPNVNDQNDISWNGDVNYKVEQKKDGIEYRIFIPWSDLRYGGWLPQMRFQLFRRRTGGDPKNGDYYSLYQVLYYHNYTPEAFPIMQFFEEESLLKQGDFEETGRAGLPAGWNGHCQLHVDDGEAFSGKNCVVVLKDKDKKLDLDYMNSDKFPVKGGADYTLRFRHKGAAGYQYVRFFDKDGKQTEEPSKPFYYCSASENWQLITQNGRIPEDAVLCEIVLRSFTPPPVFFDSVEFFSCKP